MISIQTPGDDYQRKDLVVAAGELVHQGWDLETTTRIARNIVLVDGSFILPDTLVSREVWSGYPSMTAVGDQVAYFWRESDDHIWYALTDQDGNLTLPPTQFSYLGCVWPEISASSDSLGRIHLTWDAPGGIYYSVFYPGGSEVFRDTIPESAENSLVLVDHERVHILVLGFTGGSTQLPRYLEYDLDCNMIIAPFEFADPDSDAGHSWSMSCDSEGNACILYRESILSTYDEHLSFFRIDRDTGSLLTDGKLIYTEPWGANCLWPVLLHNTLEECFYALWIENTPPSGNLNLIRFCVIDSDGELIETPYSAYDYTDENPEDLYYFRACTDDAGDVFATWTEIDPEIQKGWIRLGWFDHNWLGVWDDTTSTAGPLLLLSASCNPFLTSVTFVCEGYVLPGQLMIYDITGRLIRSLSDRQGSSFLWDGHDGSGSEVPPGTYLVRGAIDGLVSSLRIVRL
ncbi:MAG: hypothetical protein QUS11_09760 [Candidatus Fermentibacter sp.]|nr:hypothetical protein [Candidatus Fermentibacter sp.]